MTLGMYLASHAPLLAKDVAGEAARSSTTAPETQKTDTSDMVGNNVDATSADMGKTAIDIIVPGTIILPVDEEEETELYLSLQKELNRLGCKAGPEDGAWGRRSEDALTRLWEAVPQLEDLAPSLTLLALLNDMPKGTCPVICSIREVKVERECVLKTCSAGHYLDSRGVCKLRQPAAQRTKKSKRSSSGTGRKCATYNGRSYCN